MFYKREKYPRLGPKLLGDRNGVVCVRHTSAQDADGQVSDLLTESQPNDFVSCTSNSVSVITRAYRLGNVITIFATVTLEDGFLEILSELWEGMSLLNIVEKNRARTGMKAQHASWLTRVPSAHRAVSAAGAARETAARATSARREVKAIGVCKPDVLAERKASMSRGEKRVV